jgi:hypothetical protein
MLTHRHQQSQQFEICFNHISILETSQGALVVFVIHYLSISLNIEPT